jgi:hypothetical protein
MESTSSRLNIDALFFKKNYNINQQAPDSIQKSAFCKGRNKTARILRDANVVFRADKTLVRITIS